MCKITYRKSALKTLARLPRKIAAQFTTAFEQVAVNQVAELDIKKLDSREGFRLRISGYRAIYRRVHEVMVIEVIQIGSRGDIYK